MTLSKELINLVTLLIFFGGYVAAVFAIVVGIITIVRKEATTGFLGIWCLLTGIGLLISSSYTTAVRFLSQETISKFATLNGIIQILLSAAIVVFVFMYPKIRYNAKGLIAIIIIRIAVNPVNAFLNNLSAKFFFKGSSSALPAYYLTTVVSAIAALAVSIIIFLAFFKNRDKEEFIPKMWVFHLLTVIFEVVVLIISIYVTIISINDNRLVYRMIDDATLIETFVIMLSEFVIPASGIYIIINGKNKKKQLEIVG